MNGSWPARVALSLRWLKMAYPGNRDSLVIRCPLFLAVVTVHKTFSCLQEYNMLKNHPQKSTTR